MPGNQRRGCRSCALLLETVTFGPRNILFLIPGDQLASFMNAAGENGLRTFVTAANSQLKNHLLFAVFAFACGKPELDSGFIFDPAKVGLIEPVAAWLGRTPEAQCPGQEKGRRAGSLHTIEIHVGKAAGQLTEPYANILRLAVEPLVRGVFGDAPAWPALVERRLAPVWNRDRRPAASKILERGIERGHWGASRLQRPAGSTSTRSPLGILRNTSGEQVHPPPRMIAHARACTTDAALYPVHGCAEYAAIMRSTKSSGTCRCAVVQSRIRRRRRSRALIARPRRP